MLSLFTKHEISQLAS